MSKITHLVAHARALRARAMAALLLLCLGLVSPLAVAQGRPDVLWSEAGHDAAVTALDLSPDGSVLASSSADRTLKLWRYPEATLLRTLVLPYDLDAQVTGISSVRFTPDGAYVVAAVNQYNATTRLEFGTVHLFRVGDGAHVRAFGRQGQGVASVDVSPDGLWVAAAGMGKGVTIWRTADGTHVKTLKEHPGPASDVRFSPSGDRLCAGYEDGHLALWTTSDWALQWDIQAHANSLTRAAFSPSGSLVATASLDGSAKLIEAQDGTPLFTLPVGSALYAVSFAPDGLTLATGGQDRMIRQWDVANGTLARQFAASAGSLMSLRYADGGKTLLSGSHFPSRIEKWNPADGTRVQALTRLASSVDKVVYSPDSALVAIAASFDERVDVFRAGSGHRMYSWNTHTVAEDVAFSPTRQIVAMPGPDNTVVIRRLSDGKKVHTLRGHEENVVGLAFSHDGTLLASGSFFPGAIRLWNTSDWSLVREIKAGFELGAFGPFSSFSYSPDDQLLGVVAEGAPVVIRLSDGTAVAHPAGISRSVSFSPNGQFFVVSGGVNLDEVRIYRVDDWGLERTLPTGANDVAFTLDGKSLFAAHLDSVRIWRTSDWTVATTYDDELGYSGSGMGVQAIAVSPDARRFAYGRYDATLVTARNPRR